MAAFTTKSNNSNPLPANSPTSSPYVPNHRLKNKSYSDKSFGQTHPRTGGVVTTIGSNVLTSIGSVLPELDEVDDLEMNDISDIGGVGLGLAFGDVEMGMGMPRHRSNRSMRSIQGQESGESVMTSPAPAYHSMEALHVSPEGPTDGVSGIRVDVEKTVSEM